ncbi:hypothetical protein [Paenibacillus elgii]|uniref:hypothetical protein n=1 Tax=Paenibacillus elgii TaxID=189691 RepID=UPI000248D843|nr:hypothetical protein [Paenibacillus elgii]
MRKLSEIMVRSGLQTYREIIHVALFSIVSSLVLFPVLLFLPVPLALLLLVLLYVPLAAGALYACHRILQGEKGSVRTMLKGTLAHYGSSFVFGLVCALFVLILVSSWWYYGSRSGMMSLALAVFQTYFVALFFISQTYTLSLVVQERLGIFSAMGRSVKLFVARPMYTIGACFQMLCFAVLLGVTVVGFACLYMGMIGFFANLVTANVLRKDEEASPSGSGADESTAVSGDFHLAGRES